MIDVADERPLPTRALNDRAPELPVARDHRELRKIVEDILYYAAHYAYSQRFLLAS